MAQPASNDLLTFDLVPLGAIVGAGIVAAVLSIFIVTGSANDGHRAALANNQADVFAGHVEGQLAQVQSQLKSISSTIRLSQVLGSGDPSLISLEESALTQMVPNAICVRLFPTGSARVERNTIPPFSFPSLDLVTRAENGEPLTPEALEASGRWLLTIATPVRAPSSSIVNGTLFVYLDMRAISAGLPQEVDDRASIVQTFPGGAPSDIFITGSGAPGDAPVYTSAYSMTTSLPGRALSATADVLMDYVDAVADDVLVAQPLKVVVDCGHGTGGLIAEELYNNLGCETLTLYDDVDGDFPERAPEPFDEANLAALADAVRQEEADLGLALGADADRVIAVTADGSIVWPDQLLMLFARDVVARNPGSDVVYDVRCTRHLSSVVSGVGGRPIVSRCGHTFIKQKMRETDAVLGGEATGQISFSERWFGFEDGLYAGARLLEIVGSQSEPFDALVATVPFRVITPQIQVSVNEDAKFGLVERLEALSDFGDGSVSVIDGLRVDYPDGFGIVRASNSGPFLELRFEGDDDDTVSQIQDAFREQLAGVDERLNF